MMIIYKFFQCFLFWNKRFPDIYEVIIPKNNTREIELKSLNPQKDNNKNEKIC